MLLYYKFGKHLFNYHNVGSRWSIELERLHEAKNCLIGNCLLSAGFLAYTGPFSWEFRTEIVYNNWLNSVKTKDIPLVSPYRLESELTTDVTISKYVDILSLYNNWMTFSKILSFGMNIFCVCWC